MKRYVLVDPTKFPTKEAFFNELSHKASQIKVISSPAQEIDIGYIDDVLKRERRVKVVNHFYGWEKCISLVLA